jgi:predicted AlkP superfamily phosphohydrolase/phosphomutase
MKSRKKEPKAMVIGLDGVPHTLLLDYIKKGYLTEFKRILGQGFDLHQMDASIPDVSSTSWTSFMTGVNPGEHGIFGFMDLHPNTYQMFFPNSRDIHAPAVWDILGQTNKATNSTLNKRYRGSLFRPKRSVVMNIPNTYPALPINGVLTAGFVCPDLRKGTYPKTAFSYLQSIGYLSDVDVAKAAEQSDYFFGELFLSLEKRALAFEHFLKNEPWDLFIVVITETDRMQHFFFDAAMEPEHPYHTNFITIYKNIDEIVGRLFSRFMEVTDGKGLFMTMSDHGFTMLKKEVYVNAWLKEAGFLKLNNHGEYFEAIETGTRAFAMDPARIYINLEGRYPGEGVKESERPIVVNELKDRLNDLTDDCGRPIIRVVYENSDLYRGPSASKGPDLVCLAHDGFDLKGNLKKGEVFGTSHFTGMHTSYDAHCILPRELEINQRLHIEHLSTLILNNFINRGV